MQRINNVLSIVLTYTLIIIFLYTAITKLMDYDTFLNEIQRSPLLPYSLTPFIAYAVIFIEFGICILLLVERTNTFGILLSGGLLFLFTIYITMILLFSPYVPCSCGGIISQLSWTAHLILNISLILFCGYIIYTIKKVKGNV